MPGTELEQINNIMSDIYYAFAGLPDDAKEFLLQEMHEALLKRNNSSFYTLQTFKWIHSRARKMGLKVQGYSVLEIGAGKPLGTAIFWNYAGARKYSAIDKFTEINLDELWLKRFQTLLDDNLFNPYDFNINTLIRRDGNNLELNSEHIVLIQADLASHDFQGETFDFIYSNAVLEHMTGLDEMFHKLSQLLAPGGLMLHSIDLREHLSDRPIADKNTSIEFYKFSVEEWSRRYPPGSNSHINRLRLCDYRRLFEEAGFQIIHEEITQTMELTGKVYELIHPDFRHYDLRDLATLGVQFCLSKN